MFVRHHFLNLLGYILVLSIFFLNYFDKYTIKATLAVLGASAVLDFVWIIAEADVSMMVFSLTGTLMDKPSIPPFSRASSNLSTY
jgi:hypothetical protein